MMLSSDHEQASQADGREAGQACTPLLRAKDEPTETVANAPSDASDDCMMLCSDHEQPPQADGREAGPAYAPLLRVKNEPPTETVANAASDASDDCIFQSNDNKQAVQHGPADNRVVAGLKPIKDERP